LKLAIDAMGGDYAPEAVVTGAILAASEYPDLTLLLTGNESQIRQYLGHSVPDNIEIIHTSEVIEAGDEPVRAVRRKKDSSMVVAANLVKEGRADGILSAGNTGALMTASLLIIGRLEGIERPALATLWPTFDGRGVLVLDAGANMDATPEHLLQYAYMGHVYSQDVLLVEKPRIGLLNVGTEPGKGNQLTKTAFPMLAEGDFRFIGNVEARDVMNGVCDVLVCDGFVGNAMLKLAEGIGLGLFGALKDVLLQNWMSKAASLVLKPGLLKFKKTFDYKEYGGAPLLGVKGVVMKAHGSSNARAIQMAIHQARQFMLRDVLSQFVKMAGYKEHKMCNE
jgi:glycerol-3-phosphate acyltransferase PlsX